MLSIYKLFSYIYLTIIRFLEFKCIYMLIIGNIQNVNEVSVRMFYEFN